MTHVMTTHARAHISYDWRRQPRGAQRRTRENRAESPRRSTATRQDDSPQPEPHAGGCGGYHRHTHVQKYHFRHGHARNYYKHAHVICYSGKVISPLDLSRQGCWFCSLSALKNKALAGLALSHHARPHAASVFRDRAKPRLRCHRRRRRRRGRSEGG